ncbi:hypothetical protein LguiB_002626 [Lonicera macranthoides]
MTNMTRFLKITSTPSLNNFCVTSTVTSVIREIFVGKPCIRKKIGSQKGSLNLPRR